MPARQQTRTEVSQVERGRRSLGRVVVMVIIAAMVMSSFVGVVTPAVASTGPANELGGSTAFALDPASETAVLPPEVEWARTYSVSNQLGAVIQTSDGNYVAAAPATSSFDPSVYLVKTTPTGDVVWSKQYGTGGLVVQTVSSVIETSDGGLAVSAGNYVVKTDADGTFQWIYANSNLDSRPSDLIQTSDGSYALVGGFTVPTVTKIDATGTERWSRQITGIDGAARATGVIEDRGQYVVTGWRYIGNYRQGFLVKVDTTDGSQTPFSDGALARILGPEAPTYYYTVRDIVADDDAYVIGGTKAVANGISYYEPQWGNFWVVRTDGDGIISAEYEFDGGAGEDFTALARTDAGFVLTGLSRVSGYEHVWTIGVDGSGMKQWELLYENSRVSDVITTNDGGYLFAGTKDPVTTGGSALLVKLSSERVSIVDLTISTPTTGTLMNTATIGLAGTATSTESTVETVEVTDDGGATFEPALFDGLNWNYEYVAAGDGTYTLDVKATDALGAFDSQEVVVTVDTTPPTIDAVTLDPTLVAGGSSVDVIVSTSDANGVESVTANGVALTQDATDDWIGTLTAPSTDGTVTVDVVATDVAGNAATATASYTVDATAPTITSVMLDPTLVSPGDAVGVEAVVSDDNGVMTVTANGETLTDTDGDGTWTGALTAPVTDQTVSVEVVAADDVGNSDTDASASYTVDGTAPSVSLSAPATSTTETVEVSGSVTDDNGVDSAELVVDGTAQPLSLAADGSFSVTLSLAAGDHALTLRATDTVGNPAETSTTVTVTLDTDGDGLTDEEEAALGTDTENADSDGDGLTDGEEVDEYGTDPTVADTDGDGLTDGEEVFAGSDGFVTDPLNADTDGDGVDDGTEVAAGTDPTLVDVIVTIDVKPDDDGENEESPINLKSKGVIPVVIYSDADFDATAIDVATVRFGPAEVPSLKTSVEDVNGDGDTDLVVFFDQETAGFAAGDATATLTGETTNGTPFVGTDAITIVGE